MYLKNYFDQIFLDEKRLVSLNYEKRVSDKIQSLHLNPKIIILYRWATRKLFDLRDSDIFFAKGQITFF